MRFPGEIEELETAAKVAEKWGFGNLIQFLKIKWAEMLIKKHNLDPRTAGLAAQLSGHDLQDFVALEKRKAKK